MERHKPFGTLRKKISTIFKGDTTDKGKQTFQNRRSERPQPTPQPQPPLKPSILRPGEPPAIAHRDMTTSELETVTRNADNALGNLVHFAIIGGAALHFYDRGRPTHDVDILVRNGDRQLARELLRHRGEGVFNYENETVWCSTNGRCFIVDVIDPIAIELHDFENNGSFRRVMHQGVTLIHPEALLELKIHSFRRRQSQRDSEDIEWINTNLPRLNATANDFPVVQGQWNQALQGPGP